MSKPSKIPAARAALLAWYDRHRRDLPWRRTRDPYAIWLSEVMLQQTQVATVIPYWERFLARFPTVAALAAAPLDEVLGLWRGLGYYSRARNLHRAAQVVVAEHGGRFPSTAAALLELPGFGRYTAGAVASIAFGEPAPLVDGNVARVFSRLEADASPPGDPAREKRLWALAAEWVVGARPGELNQALMELGAQVCRPDKPLCLLCPVREHCRAHAEGRAEAIPPAKVRPPRKALRLAVAAFSRGEALLLAQRNGRGLFGGLWELPSTEVPAGAGEAEIAASWTEAFGAGIRLGAPLGRIERTLTHRALTLDLFAASGRAPDRGGGYAQFRWATFEEAAELGVSTAMQKALALVADRPPPKRRARG